ncbi:MAG: indolepyruvate ferredoxin oxidoreductase subunit beta [Deltaproteobacteria bacterium]
MIRMRILFTGVGGQGTLLASRLLGEAAMSAGIPVRVSEVHGMAQRGGVVESTVMLGGIESPIIAEGEADLLVGFEPLETLRALRFCSADTVIVTNTAPIPPITVTLGQAEYPDVPRWLEFMGSTFRKVIAYDAEAVAREAGSTKTLNVVLLGTLCATGLLPLGPESLRETIRRRIKPKLVDVNLAAFDKGLVQVQ